MIPRRAVVCLLLALACPARGAAADPATPAPAPAAAAPLVPTVIESGALDMVSTAKETTFTYSQGVKVTATNLALTCDELVVVARRAGDPSALLGKQEKFKSMIATGGVRIVQDDREATAARAEVFPDDDKVVLTGNPVVRSLKDGWQQTGPKMELLRGERRAIIKSEGEVRPRTILPPLKDLGYDKVPEKKKPAPVIAPAAREETPATVTVPIPAPKP
jgi:lipopolysaccharide export system protein LptA